MAHPSKEEILRASEGGWAEVERLAAHLASCAVCRAHAAGSLSARPVAGKRAKVLKALSELASFEKAVAVDRLLAKAELAELRRLTKGAQKEKVILSRSCHSPAFIDVLRSALSSLRLGVETEALASLAVLAVQGMDPAEAGEALKNDLLAGIGIELANTRRIRAEWQQARATLHRAATRLEAGTGDPGLKARWLSIAGSLQVDQGEVDPAMASLEECRRICEDRSDWPLVGRTLVQMAHCMADRDPGRALTLLDRASIYIEVQDTGLRSLAQRIRTDCLVTLGRLDDAVQAFTEAERLRPEHGRPSAAIRSTFIAARLLEALGQTEAAEALFNAVVADDLDQGFVRDAVLDLVYIFSFHLRIGSSERAASLGLLVLEELDRQDSAASEQFRSVLTRLVDAARGQRLDEGMVQAAHDSLRVQWKRPAPSRPPALGWDRRLIDPLLAKARWCSLRQKHRREQHARVARASEFHTAAFANLLLSGVREADSPDEAEFMASLALQALRPMEEAPVLKEDLQMQLWTEVANVRRVASDWTKARAALVQAERHAAQGSGDPLLKGRAQSVAASLAADQGDRVEAVATLEQCVQLYERLGAWPLVARITVQMAHTLVDTEPARALALVERAVPLTPPSDATLRCLAANIRADGLIILGELDQALQVFQQAEPLRSLNVSSRAIRRSDFLAARLLDVHGHTKEAVQLFEAVIADAFEHEAYREAFLDLLYLFGVHIRQGATESAVALCRRALDRLELFDLGHDQVKALWRDLMDAATRRAVGVDSLAEVREFLRVHWKHPAPTPPRFSFR